ncbi:hypothetical protein [Verrucomicrobium sp. BvORR034]|uniref:hypothetical protein n=1 Tax=Verrucomicrobium sp. BvORR034 TaxID=1396418 RepID=UPI0006799B46|nr:hypothetical protein [Verrucomicrobium sp. BvORR034]
MADIALTAANVLKSSAGNQTQGTAGEAIAAGDTLCKNTTDQKLYKADGNDATKKDVAGVALNTAGAGQPLFYVLEDVDLVLGAHGVPVGTVIVQSATPGKMCPAEDLAAGNYTTVLGVIKTATTMALRPVGGGVAVPA